MLVDVVNRDGEKVSQIDLKDGILGDSNREHLFYEALKMQLAGRRAGTASTKTRSMVRGGGAKPFRQKGTGRARQGSSRSPLNRHGGVVFGPRPRNYSYKLPKKVVKGAISSAIAHKINSGKLKVLKELSLNGPKTSELVGIFKNLGSSTALIITEGPDRNLELAVRNIKGFKALRFDGLNLFDIFKYDHLIFTTAAIGKLEEKFSR